MGGTPPHFLKENVLFLKSSDYWKTSKTLCVLAIRNHNIAFARGGAHLPIAHALLLLSSKEIGGVFFFGGGANFKSFFLFLDEIEIEKK